MRAAQRESIYACVIGCHTVAYEQFPDVEDRSRAATAPETDEVILSYNTGASIDAAVEVTSSTSPDPGRREANELLPDRGLPKLWNSRELIGRESAQAHLSQSR